MNQAFLSFNGGELSPYGYHRTDLDKHTTGCAHLENFLPLPFGALRKRPGTYHLATLSGPSKVEPFHLSSGEAYILVFSATTLTVFRTDGTSITDLPLVTSDYSLIQVKQLNDIAFITAPDFPPQRLSHVNDTTWTLEAIPFTSEPYISENTSPISITTDFGQDLNPPAWSIGTHYAHGSHVTHNQSIWRVGHAQNTTATTNNSPGKNVTFTDSDGTQYTYPYWTPVATPTATPNQIISLHRAALDDSSWPQSIVSTPIKIKTLRSPDQFEVDLILNTSNQPSPPLLIKGSWELATFGIWNGTVNIEQSTNQGYTWETIRSYKSNSDRNISATGDIDTLSLIRINFIRVSHSGAPRATLSVSDGYIESFLEVTERISDTEVKAICRTITPVATTELWSYGAFSPMHGYPRALAIHDRRLIFGGTTSHPNSLWFSQTDDLLNFETGTDDTDGLYITLAASRQDPILWIESQTHLIIGTTANEWVSSNTENKDIITPTALQLKQATNYGSSPLPPLAVHSSLLFIQRQGRRLQEYAYTYERENYDGTDLSRLAEHITESGITDATFQFNREPTLWATLANGTLLTFTYARKEAITAWARHSTINGHFRSVTSLRNATADDDVVFIVERDSTWHLEKLASEQQRVAEEADLDNAHYVDSGVYGSAPTSTLATPSHLDGKILHILADDIFYTATPADGTLTLPSPAIHVHAGLPITSTLTTLPLDIITKQGPTHSMLKEADQLTLDVLNSFGGCVIYREKERTIRDLTPSTFGNNKPLKSGWVSQSLDSGTTQDLSLTICQAHPYPFTLRAAVISWQQTERR